MEVQAIRNWLGLYFLILTGVFGAYVLLAGGSPLLPIEQSEALDSLQILIPVLLGQLTIIFQWFGGEQPDDGKRLVRIPPWVVKAPLILVSVILALAVSVLVLGNLDGGRQWAIGPDSFQGTVTFAVSILNGTSVFVIARFFNPPKRN